MRNLGAISGDICAEISSVLRGVNVCDRVWRKVLGKEAAQDCKGSQQQKCSFRKSKLLAHALWMGWVLVPNTCIRACK